MNIRFVELSEPLREGGLEKAAADMAFYLNQNGMNVIRGRGDFADGLPADLVHFHGLWSLEHFKIARNCRTKGIPTVVSPHGMLEPWAWRHRRWKKWPYFHMIEKRRLKRATALLTTATEEAANLRTFFPNAPITVLPLGMEPHVRPDYEEARAALGWMEDERILLYLSRVHPKKGLKELLDALEIVSRGGGIPSLRLVIVGDGPSGYVDECKVLSASLNDRIRVDWIAPQWGDAKWPYLQGADLFCLPTYSENFGLVVLESGMVGTPVFTTTGTPWKVIEDNGFGWVPAPVPHQYPPVLRAFLATSKEELAGRREAFASWTMVNYAWPNLVMRYRQFYQEIVDRACS